ncbi:MAG: hypothetical protein R2729_13520 [Bryobacteraceae bacterium]
MARGALIVTLTLVCSIDGLGASQSKECGWILERQQIVRMALPVAANWRVHDNRFDLIESAKDQVSTFPLCKSSWIKAYVKEGEFPVLLGRMNHVIMTVEGDICAPSPKFVMHDVQRMEDLYPFYYHDGSMSNDPMVPRIGAALAIARRRCGGREPAELRFVARRIKTLPQEISFKADQGRLKRVDWEEEDFISGKVVAGPGLRYVGDDQAWEQAYWTTQERQLSAAQLKAKEDKVWQNIAIIFALAALGGLGASISERP